MHESVQEMLWMAAESGDAEAITEFERRYPQYRGELARVRAMVEAMRSARPMRTTVEAFRQPARRSESVFARLALVASVFLGLAIVGYGAYRITDLVTHRDGAGWSNTGVTGSETPTDVAKGSGTSTAPPAIPTEPEPEPQGIAARPVVPQTRREPMVSLRGDATLFQAISAFRAAGMTVHVDPAVEDLSLGLAPENPDALLTLRPDEAAMLLERVAPVRVQEIGPKEFLVIPLEKVNNLEAAPAKRAEPARNQEGAG
ncbi:MAG: hypothetical protein C4341_06735 [Armatimonadota bacterium]